MLLLELSHFDCADLDFGVYRIMNRRRDVIKQRIQQERIRVVLTANSAMVLLYWDIGRTILDRQEREGWSARVIDRLATDLREAFPNMQGFSPRNLKYMRAFAAAWPERAIVQEALAQIPWYHHIALLEKLDDPVERLWYARQAMEHGWSHKHILALQINARAISVADYHPLSVQRSAPAIQRVRRTVVHESNLVQPPAADPQRS